MRMKRHFTNSFLMFAKHLQQPLHQKQGVTFHGQTHANVRWLTWKTLRAFVVNCDFINENISTVTKFGTRILTLCCQKKVKYCMIKVFSVKCNVLVELQNLTFPTKVYLNVFLVLMWWTRSWSLSMHFRQNVVRTWVYKPISPCFSFPKINYLFLLKWTLLNHEILYLIIHINLLTASRIFNSHMMINA